MILNDVSRRAVVMIGWGRSYSIGDVAYMVADRYKLNNSTIVELYPVSWIDGEFKFTNGTRLRKSIDTTVSIVGNKFDIVTSL